MAKRKGGKFLKVLGKNYLDAERDKTLIVEPPNSI